MADASPPERPRDPERRGQTLDPYELLFERSVDGVILTRSDGAILRANPAACRALGRTEAEIRRLGRAGLVVATDELPALIQERERKGQVEGELLMRRADGTIFPIEFSSALLPTDDGAPLASVIFRDATARKRAADALRRANRALRMLTASNLAVVRSTSEEALFAEVCRVFVEIGGYRLCWIGVAEDDERRTVRPVAHAGEDAGYLLAAGVVWSDTPRGRGPTGTALREGQPVIGREFDCDPTLAPWREDALRRGYRSCSALPLVHGGDRLAAITMYAAEQAAFDDEEARILGQLADALAFGVVSLRRRVQHERAQRELLEAEAQRRRLEEQFQQAQRLESVGRLAGGVAHDFNNLLTVILSCSSALRDDLRSGAPVQLEDVEEIHGAGERARDLTRQLLAFARKQVIAPVPLDLGEAVRGMEKLLRRVLGEDIVLAVDAQPASWRVRCDPGQVEQAILNLAVNARDAMPRGGRLAIETSNVRLDEADLASRPGAQAGSFVRLLVRDAGHGMAPDVQAHLFEPFFTTKEPGKGTGLGLATVYGIVKQNEGFILVDSAVGNGTTFELFFPRWTEPVDATSRAAPARAPRGTETVLVVEDDAKVRAVTVRALRSGGYRVLEAGSGVEAIALAQREAGPIALVVTDVVMPAMGGRAVAEALRRSRPDLRVLYVSGYTQDAVLERGVLEEVVQFLPKPFTPASLLARVRAVLDA